MRGSRVIEVTSASMWSFRKKKSLTSAKQIAQNMPDIKKIIHSLIRSIIPPAPTEEISQTAAKISTETFGDKEETLYVKIYSV